MRFTLPSRLVGTLTAATLALTTFTAAPAYADDERTAQIIAAILGLAVVGSIINDRKHDKEDAQRYTRKVHKPAHTTHQRLHRHGQIKHNHRGGQGAHQHRRTHTQPRHTLQPKPLPRRVGRKQLPRNCFRSFETRRGTANMFVRRCLERNYRAVNRLPQNCAMRVRTTQGTRSGWDARCLRRNGYSLARG